MGIKNLSKFLKERFPSLFENIHISDYAYQKVAIDTSLYMCHYKASYGEIGWLEAFIRLVSCLRQNEIHCVFIYDSGHPIEKTNEKKQRSEQKEKARNRINDVERLLEEYEQTNIITPALSKFHDERLPSTIFTIKGVQFELAKMKKQNFTVTKEDFLVTKKLFDILKVPYFDAPLEAETMCADLCIQGKVDAVLSEDTDVLAYGAPVFLTKVNAGGGSCMRINYNKLLEEIGMSKEEFTDFCIMCGTDYNNNIPKVGIVNAYKLIQEHKSIDTVALETKYDVSILNHVRGRELFAGYTKTDITPKYCGRPDFISLQTFMFKKGIRLSVDSIKDFFIRDSIIIE